MHEIINIQIGSQSNFLGTHFWNAQESYFTYEAGQESGVDHGFSFRPGIGADGADTYTPRALIYDIKDAFGTLRQSNALYETLENDPLQHLSGTSSLIQQPPIPQHPYQQYLELNGELPSLTSDNVRYWSDFNRVYYHPRSLVQMQFDTITTASSSLNSWTAGVELFDKDDREHDILDRDFRLFAEECDQLQGVCIVAGVDNAWGGFTSRYVERLRDELDKASIWVWGVYEPLRAAENTRDGRFSRSVNSIRSLESLAVNASLYTPLSAFTQHLPGYLNVNSESAWETSALQAAILETSTLPFRLKHPSSTRTTLSDLEQLFTATVANRKILHAELSQQQATVPTNGVMTNGLTDESHDHRITEAAAVDASEDNLDVSFFPAFETLPQPHLFDAFSVVRGLHGDQQSTSSGREDPYQPTVLRISSPETFPSSLSSYPHIFHSEQSSASSDVALHTRLATDSSVATWLRRMADMSGAVLPAQDREDVSSALRTWADDYVEGWEGDEEDSDSE